MLECYNKKLLRVNLTTRTIREEPLSDEFISRWVGGMGFGVRLLTQEVKPDVPDDQQPRSCSVQWVLVASPGLLRAARGRLGSQASCPFCGRAGRIVRVVSLLQWCRRVRYGFG